MNKLARKMPYTAKAHGPDPVDVHVGRRLRLRRTLLGYSQMQLAAAVGVTFQQIQKYERGANRASASRLYDIARVLLVPISYFFEDLGTDAVNQRPTHNLPEEAGLSVDRSAAPPFEADQMSRTETLDIVRIYWSLPADRRRALRELMQVMAPASSR
jgi:transcriptional regulator with XRE-family HTH domain